MEETAAPLRRLPARAKRPVTDGGGMMGSPVAGGRGAATGSFGGAALNGGGAGAGHNDGADGGGRGKGGKGGGRTGPMRVQRVGRGSGDRNSMQDDRRRMAKHRDIDSEVSWRSTSMEESRAFIDGMNGQEAPGPRRANHTSAGSTPSQPSQVENHQAAEASGGTNFGSLTPTEPTSPLVAGQVAAGPGFRAGPGNTAAGPIAFGSIDERTPLSSAATPWTMVQGGMPGAVMMVPMVMPGNGQSGAMPGQYMQGSMPMQAMQTGQVAPQGSAMSPTQGIAMSPTQGQVREVPRELPVKGRPRLMNAKIARVGKEVIQQAPAADCAASDLAAATPSAMPEVVESQAAASPPTPASPLTPELAAATAGRFEDEYGRDDAQPDNGGGDTKPADASSGLPKEEQIEDFATFLADLRGGTEANDDVAQPARIAPALGRGRGRGRLVNVRLERGRGRSGVAGEHIEGTAEVEDAEEKPEIAPACVENNDTATAAAAGAAGRGGGRAGRRGGRLAGRGTTSGGANLEEEVSGAATIDNDDSPVAAAASTAQNGRAQATASATTDETPPSPSTTKSSARVARASWAEQADEDESEDDVSPAVPSSSTTAPAPARTPEKTVTPPLETAPEVASPSSPPASSPRPVTSPGPARIGSPPAENGSINVVGWERAFRRDDELLRMCGLWCKKVEADGACLFRAFSDQLEGDGGSNHMKYRGMCVSFLEANRADFEHFVEGNFKGYCAKLGEPAEWAGEIEAQALCRALNVNAIIHRPDQAQSADEVPELAVEVRNFAEDARCVQLCFHPRYHAGPHYNSVRALGDKGDGMPPLLDILELQEKMSEALRSKK